MTQQSNLNVIKNYYEIFLNQPRRFRQKMENFFEDLDSEASEFLKNNSFNDEHKMKRIKNILNKIIKKMNILPIH